MSSPWISPRPFGPRLIAPGDLVIVYEGHEKMKPVYVTPGGTLQNRFGVFRHRDWIGGTFGRKARARGFVAEMGPGGRAGGLMGGPRV